MGDDLTPHASNLTSAHHRELVHGSSIDQATVEARGYRSLAKHQSAELDALGILYRANSFPGLLIPIYRATGEIISAQFKPATPLSINGRSVKYLSPRGCASHLDVHPVNRTRIRDLDTPLWITEGVKKGDALTSRGCCVVTLMGVFNWRSKLGTLGDWEDVPLKGREVVICFDADAKKNMNVARAMVRLGRWCKSKGARLVKYLIVPGECHGKPTKGADDYFVAGDTLDMLLAAATPTEPDTETFDDAFSDARLAETLADDTLADHFVWNRSLGWFAWAGTHWSLGSEEAVTEVARQYVIGRFKSAADRSQKSQTAGWLKVMQAPRLRAVLSLTRGILERPVEAFDADADLLNTPTGTVHLPTGDMREHDPDQLITKVTRGSYRRGATHIDWEAALSAVPASVQPWLQVRIGQAFAGHPTPDGVVLVEHGAGENGKTALNTALLAAGGGYAGMASPRLLTGSKDSHTTERADLRGQRFVLAEELTEDRSLNTTAIKQIVDVTRIKARYINRDNFEFECSHSLFITTNYVPSINETDHGTWRRFALVTFPYTFKSSPRPLTNSTDRRGDPGLKPRLKAGQDGQHDAVITWVVDGAWQFYQSGLPVMPAIVERHTRAWRRQADRILGFWDDALVADAEACVLTTELLATFNDWLKANGHHAWSKESFHPRFRSHVETRSHGVEERRTNKPSGLSHAPAVAWNDVPQQPQVYVGVRFLGRGELRENTEENTELADLADLQGRCLEKDYLENHPQGSARSASDGLPGAHRGGAIDGRF